MISEDQVEYLIILTEPKERGPATKTHRNNKELTVADFIKKFTDNLEKMLPLVREIHE